MASNGRGPLSDDDPVSRSFPKTYRALGRGDCGTSRSCHAGTSCEEDSQRTIEQNSSAARVSLKASEIEKGMSEKNPTISLPSLYQQVPEIFLRGVRPDDQTRVALPYEKVLEQFKSAYVRTDQMRDPAVPQVETPILKS